MKNLAAYWNRGVGMVPIMTGAATLMDGADILEHAERLGFALPFDAVIDVGCGTGRLAQFASVYVGLDIAQDAVDYCRRAGLYAHLIGGPDSMPLTPLTSSHRDWVTCLSVFTHIARAERVAYLRTFTHLAEQLLVDIIPGDGQGDVALWTADPASFERDLADTGWRVEASYDRVAPDGPTHRYYRCRRAEAQGIRHAARLMGEYDDAMQLVVRYIDTDGRPITQGEWRQWEWVEITSKGDAVDIRRFIQSRRRGVQPQLVSP